MTQQRRVYESRRVRSYELRRRFADFVTTRFTVCLPIVSLVCNLARNYPHTMPLYSRNTSNRRVAQIVITPPPFSFRFRQRKAFFFSVSRGKLRVSYVTISLSLSLTRSLEREFDRVWSSLTQCVSLLLWFYGGTLSSEEERIIGWWARLLFLG